jgi:hypothetical protein
LVIILAIKEKSESIFHASSPFLNKTEQYCDCSFLTQNLQKKLKIIQVQRFAPLNKSGDTSFYLFGVICQDGTVLRPEKQLLGAQAGSQKIFLKRVTRGFRI